MDHGDKDSLMPDGKPSLDDVVKLYNSYSGRDDPTITTGNFNRGISVTMSIL